LDFMTVCRAAGSLPEGEQLDAELTPTLIGEK
jgi:hypothetical protein